MKELNNEQNQTASLLPTEDENSPSAGERLVLTPLILATSNKKAAGDMLRQKAESIAPDETTLDFLETQLPAQAIAATQAAYWGALTRGYSVVRAQGDDLCEIAPDGSRRVLKQLEPNVILPAGIKITL